MERLTVRRDHGITMADGWDFGIDPEDFDLVQDILARLAAYEDTGLEPEEVQYLKGFVTGGIHKVDDGWAHVQELMDAEKDGRLVVLAEPRQPLVWGDDGHNAILCPNCGRDLMGGFELADSSEVTMFQCPHCGQPIDGCRAVTREEAEAALEGGGNDG